MPDLGSPNLLPNAYNTHRPTTSDPSRLAPEDAFYASSPPRRERRLSPLGLGAAAGTGPRSLGDVRRKRDKDRDPSSHRRRKGAWKKLLWVRQSYPDNHTDEDTFLDHLQRNPRLLPYEFWALVADLTVIVQHVCSVAIFICCFTWIFRRQISPISVVGWATFVTVLGWVLWDSWVSKEDAIDTIDLEGDHETGESNHSSSSSPTNNLDFGSPPDGSGNQGLGLQMSPPALQPAKPRPRARAASLLQPPAVAIAAPSSPTGHPTGAPTFANYSNYPPYSGHGAQSLSPRNQQRLATLKSAMLIFCALLGLSPILKSLTLGWTSDSIWAMSVGLVCINFFFFDYGGGQAKLPASFSMNAGVMASTVLASRLDSTTDVFSLSLFSVEVFALFPIFRRYLRHISWNGHLTLTVLLVTGAGASVGLTISKSPSWKSALGGVILGDVVMIFSMGVTAWWLIGLQKYKNEIHGPWDPARPIIRRRWD